MGVRLTFLGCDFPGAVVSTPGQAGAEGRGPPNPPLPRAGTARSRRPARACHPSALPCCHSGSKWGFIASCFPTAAGPGSGGSCPPAPAGRAGPGRGGVGAALSLPAPSFGRRPLALPFLCSVSPGRGLFPGRKPGKSTLLKCSGGLCNGKPSGFAKQMPQIRVGGCTERPLSAGRLPQCPTSPPS